MSRNNFLCFLLLVLSFLIFFTQIYYCRAIYNNPSQLLLQVNVLYHFSGLEISNSQEPVKAHWDHIVIHHFQILDSSFTAFDYMNCLKILSCVANSNRPCLISEEKITSAIWQAEVVDHSLIYLFVQAWLSLSFDVVKSHTTIWGTCVKYSTWGFLDGSVIWSTEIIEGNF